MKYYKFFTIAIAILALTTALHSCKSDDDNNYQMDDQSFVNQAASSNNFEIAAGTLAGSHSTNVSVQQFGSHMVTEHTAVGIDLKAIAESKELIFPSTLQTKEQNNLSTLSNLYGSEFDAAFTTMMVTSHEEAITLFSTASGSSGVKDGDLRNFAANKLPALKTHLKEAQDLQATVNP